MSLKYNNILKIYIQKLKYFNYFQRTIEIYVHYTKKFLLSVDKYPQHIVSSDFKNYLDNYNFSSISQQNQIINAIKFLYEKVLDRKYDKVSFKRPIKEKYLPQIIDNVFLLDKINQIQNLKHKAILSLAYSVGLRVSEVINLKILDVDSNRMIMVIRQAKSNKDRIVPLSKNILESLRSYYKEYELARQFKGVCGNMKEIYEGLEDCYNGI
jgi:integrase/recombinase XerD